MLEKKPSFEQATYHVFRSFFEPHSTYEKTDFIIIQDKIDVRIIDDDFDEIFVGTKVSNEFHESPVVSHLIVEDFRPEVPKTKKKVLYLDEDHLSELLYFLHREPVPVRKKDYIVSSSDEHYRRLDYLNRVLTILPGHWGKGWHFETHPYVFSIQFNPTLSRAVLHFRVGYGGGEALLERSEENWVVVETRDDQWAE